MYDGLHDGTLLNHWPPHRRQETRCGRSNKRLRGGGHPRFALPELLCRPIDIHATGISAASSPRGVRCLQGEPGSRKGVLHLVAVQKS